MKIRAISTLLCAVLAAVLLLGSVFTFLRPIFTVRIPASGSLALTAGGVKNPASAGSEVRIRQIELDGVPLDLGALAATPGWSLDGDLLVAYGSSAPVTLTIPMERTETLTLSTVGQRGSGYLELTLGDFQETLDLYADSDWEEEVRYVDLAAATFAPITRIDLLIEMWLIYVAAIYFIAWECRKKFWVGKPRTPNRMINR